MTKCEHLCERNDQSGSPRRNLPKGCLQNMAVPRRRKTRRSTWFLPGALAVLVLTIASGLFLAPAATTTAAPQTIGNDVINRPFVDGASDVIIIDRNTSAAVAMGLNQFDVWAKNTNAFRVLVVDAANEITYVSEEFTPVVGFNSFFPATVALVDPGDYLALYFPGTGSIAYSAPAGTSRYSALAWGLPSTGQTVSGGATSPRTYSLKAFGTCYSVCYVNQITGDDTNDGLSPATPLATIQEGVDRVMDGGEVIVAPGVYVENVLIEDPVTLTGPNAGVAGHATRGPEATIDGDFSGDTVHIHDADGVTVNGFRIVNGDFDNVSAHDAANVSIINNIIHAAAEDAVDFNIVDGGTIGANLITGTGYNAVYVDGGFDIVIRDNVIRDNGDEDPVDIFDVVGLEILRNRIFDNACANCDAALEIENTQDVLIAENEIEEFSAFSDGDALEIDNNNIGVVVRNNFLAGDGDAIDIDGSGNDNISVYQNHLGDTGDAGLELDSGNYAGITLMAERNWWGFGDGPSGDGPGSGVQLDDPDGVVDFDPWLCRGVDQSPAIGFQPNLTDVNPCDTTKPVWTATWSKWAEGPNTYTPGDWSTKYVILTFQCTDEPGGSGIDVKRGDLEVVFNEDGIWDDDDPIIGPEGSIKGDAADENCIDNAGNVADPIDPLTAGQTVKVDTTAPVCKPANGTIRLKKNQTHLGVTNIIDGSDPTSGVVISSAAAAPYGGASVDNFTFVGAAPNRAVSMDITFPNSTASGATVNVSLTDAAGNTSTCSFVVRAK